MGLKNSLWIRLETERSKLNISYFALKSLNRSDNSDSLELMLFFNIFNT